MNSVYLKRFRSSSEDKSHEAERLQGRPMNTADYEYKGLLARSWDFLRGDTSDFPDRQFYREAIRKSGEPVLVVGCGTGRLLLEYQGEGMDADGLDVSPEMLNICREKAAQQSLQVTVHLQAMEAIDLQRQYRTIIVPSSSFQLVSDLTDAEDALAGFFAHLHPGGLLAMAIWHIQSDGIGEWRDWWLVADKEGFEDGKRIRRWERSMYDPATQLRHTENRYELLQSDEVHYAEIHRRSPEMRSYSPYQLTHMMENTDFIPVHAMAGFSSAPASDTDETLTILGSRPPL